MHLKLINKTLYFDKYKVKCAIGKRGITSKKREGDEKTPRGRLKFLSIFYRKDRVKKIRVKIKKYCIKKNMGWCDDPNSKKYNKLINLPFNFKYEKLFKKENTYDIILVLNYNMNPIRKNKGSAIFIHVAKKNYKKTKGCVATGKTQLLKLLKKIKINTKAKIVHQK